MMYQYTRIDKSSLLAALGCYVAVAAPGTVQALELVADFVQHSRTGSDFVAGNELYHLLRNLAELNPDPAFQHGLYLVARQAGLSWPRADYYIAGNSAPGLLEAQPVRELPAGREVFTVRAWCKKRPIAVAVED